MDYDITPFDPSSEGPDLIALWRETLHTTDSGKAHLLDRRLDWLYRGQQPTTTHVARRAAEPLSGAERSAQDVIARDTRGQLVGCASLYPRQLWYGGQEHRVGTGCDFAVTRAHRGLGPALALQRSVTTSSMADGFHLLLVRPDQASAGLFRHVGYREIGVSERWVKVLRPQRYAEDINNSPLVVAMSQLASRGLHMVDLALKIPLLRESRRVRIEILDRVDPRFDVLWTEARANYPLTEVRSAAYLTWRYVDVVGQSHRFCCVVDRQTDRLLGYVVFVVDGDTACVSDLFAVDRGRTMDLLLAEFVTAMHREGLSAISIVFMQNELMRSRLKRLFFLKREQLRPILAYHHPDAPEHLRQGVMGNAHDWLLFDGGMDI